MKGYSAFANKVWNAARFILMNLREEDTPVVPEEIDEFVARNRDAIPLEDMWILHRMNRVSAEISEALDKFRFHEASALIYQFIWHEFCDWYIELVKPVLTNPQVPEQEREPRVKVLVHTMDFALRMLHPFMPFITEEIWQKIPHAGESIMVQEFPSFRQVLDHPGAAQSMQDIMDLVGAIRSLRAEMNIDPKRLLDAVLVIQSGEARTLVSENLEKVRSLARLNRVEFSDTASGNLLRGVWSHGEFGLDVHDAIDVASERERMTREITRIRGEIEKLEKKIGNPDFVSRAPEEVVAENRIRHEELLDRYQKLESNLNRFPAS